MGFNETDYEKQVNGPENPIYRLLALLLIIIVLGVPGGVIAEEAVSDLDTDYVLEEVIVTARKTDERVQDTPVSVTAFTAESLMQAGAMSIDDIALRTPGLRYTNRNDEKLGGLSLRGVVSTMSSAGSDPAVGRYVDEIYLGHGPGASFDLFDVERVEVLRGPQGTLFGRNTIGGLINYMTKRPTEEFEASLEATYGNYNYLRLGAVVSGQIAEGKVSGRIAAVYDSRDGTSDNIYLNRDVNTKGAWQMRGKLLFTPAENTELLFTLEYREVDKDPLNYDTLRYNETPGFFPSIIDAFGHPRNLDPYDRNTLADIEQEETLELWGISMDLRTKIGGIKVTNILSYRDHDYYSRADTERSTLSWAYDGDPEDGYRLNEELRLAWSTGDFDWLAGFYFFQQDMTNLSFVELGSVLAPFLGGTGGDLIGSDAAMKTTSWAGFASWTWNVSERFDFTLGGRYTYEEKEIDYTQVDPFWVLGGDFAFTGKDDWAEFTPSLTMRYRIRPDVMAYANVSKGFKSGGFNDALGDADGISFDPEMLWNYELGLKTEWLNSRVRANFTAFYMDWADIQIREDNLATPAIYDPIITNAGEAHTLGVEVELLAQPIRELTVGLNFAILEAEFDEGTLPVSPTSELPLDRIPYAPEYTASMYAQYRAPFSAFGKDLYWSVGGELLARGETYLTSDNQEDGRVDPYALINLRAGVASQDGRWQLNVCGRNVTDVEEPQHLVDAFDTSFQGTKYIILNDPPTVSVELRCKF
ncbi:MAG: TonB-dependent receptor [Deltaproteobacteria bacterium]|nr:TonB-dependent receptor [Deltaproteobacteria bacterium]